MAHMDLFQKKVSNPLHKFLCMLREYLEYLETLRGTSFVVSNEVGSVPVSGFLEHVCWEANILNFPVCIPLCSPILAGPVVEVHVPLHGGTGACLAEPDPDQRRGARFLKTKLVFEEEEIVNIYGARFLGYL